MSDTPFPENPFGDYLAFLTTVKDQNPIWAIAIYWALLVVGIAIAVVVWSRTPAQRTAANIGRLLLRGAIGTMWWQQTLWKIPNNFDGLKGFMQNIVDHGSIPFQSAIVRDYIIPNISITGVLVYGAEALVGISLILGAFTRLGALLGLGIALNLWLGLYLAPGEWDWTYGYLVVLQLIYVVDPPGRALGFDALGRAPAGVIVGQPARA